MIVLIQQAQPPGTVTGHLVNPLTEARRLPPQDPRRTEIERTVAALLEAYAELP